MTKKLTKKLISIFLSLLMVLSLIPIGAMSALAAEHNINTGSITKSFSLTVQPNDVVKFNVTENNGVFIITELEGYFGEYVTLTNKEGEFTNASWAVPSNGTLTVYEKDTLNEMPLWNLLFTAKCPNGHKVDTSIESTDADEDRCIVYCENRPCKYHNNGFEYTHIDRFVCPYCFNEKHVPTHTCSLGSKITGQAAECSVDGWNDYYQCTEATCGKIYATNNTAGTAYDDLDAWKASTAGKINELDHDWGTTPTYGYGAKYHWEVCSRDASHAQNREAHSGGTATCTAAAVCSTCGASYGTVAGHSFATEWSKDATHHWHAATCEHSTEKSGYAQHSYISETTTPATCTSAGVTTYTCTCGDTYTDETAPAALGHSFTNYVPNYDATCTEDGTKTATCDRTGCSVTDTVTDEGTATGHSFTKYFSDKNATCTKDGTKTATCDNNCGETHTVTDVNSKTGHKYTSKVTKAATYSAAGVRTYTCSNGCGASYKETIPRLKITSTVKYNNSTNMNAAFKVSSSTKDVTVKWGKVAGADGYMIYANYCGNDTKPVLIKTIKGEDTKTYSFSKMNGKNIDLTKNLKVYVVAYSTIDGKKAEIGKSITGHVVGGKSKKYTNSTKITVKNSKVTLNVGKTSTIKATVTYKDPKKKPVGDSHAPEKRYRSSNKAIATVDANGKIKAVGKGTCTVYVFAKNGTSAKVTVTVK